MRSSGNATRRAVPTYKGRRTTIAGDLRTFRANPGGYPSTIRPTRPPNSRDGAVLLLLLVVPDQTPPENGGSRINPSRIDPSRSPIPDRPSAEASFPTRSQDSHCARLVDGAQNRPPRPASLTVPRQAGGPCSGRPPSSTRVLRTRRRAVVKGAGGRAASVTLCRVFHRMTHRASLRELHCAVATVHTTGGRQRNK